MHILLMLVRNLDLLLLFVAEYQINLQKSSDQFDEIEIKVCRFFFKIFNWKILKSKKLSAIFETKKSTNRWKIKNDRKSFFSPQILKSWKINKSLENQKSVIIDKTRSHFFWGKINRSLENQKSVKIDKTRSHFFWGKINRSFTNPKTKKSVSFGQRAKS